ncbi:hypothetical protein OIU76_024353 [Salix suchowensis]|nr:hypothetical protein OIU76_024353 [Salix suchowensis]
MKKEEKTIRRRNQTIHRGETSPKKR